MNKKKIIIIISSVFGTFVLIALCVFGYFYYQNNFSNKTVLKNEIENLQTSEESQEENTQNLSTDDKISILRNRFYLKGVIDKGDDYISQNTPMLALAEYLKAYAKNSNDPEIIKKVGFTYFELKNYKFAIEYLDKIKDQLSNEDLDIYIYSNIYNLTTKDKRTFDNAQANIAGLKNLSDDDKFYYKNSINCVISFHTCKKDFQDYFSKTQITSQKLKNIKSAIDNYDAFKSGNTYYKDSLIIAELFKDKLYNITNYLSVSMLKSKTDYKPFILMAGKGFYEIGDMANSKKYLEKYYKLEPKDSKVAYLLGKIYYHTRDYVTSNMYYNAAIDNNYENKVDIKRKIVYNYYMLGQKKQMFETFNSLILEKDSTVDDYSLAIYRYILNGDLNMGMIISNKGLEKFKDASGVEIFYGYLGWIYREKGDLTNANNYLETGLKINAKNALLTLNMGYLASLKGDYNKALIYLKRTQTFNPDSEFGKLAYNQIAQIEKMANNSGNTSSGNNIKK